jgi:hypothetical protein
MTVVYETVMEADPDPEKASTAKTWKLKFLFAKPCWAQALKWLDVVTVPEVRLLWRTDQYWVNVLVPVMDGWLVRVSVQSVYVLPSELTVPSCVTPEEQGLNEP